MSILSGFKRFKDYILTDNGYQLSSRWTHANSVELSNGLMLDESRVELTQAEYDALGDEKLTNNVDYYITDGNTQGGQEASDISYNNSTSGMESKNVQGAIDELNSNLFTGTPLHSEKLYPIQSNITSGTWSFTAQTNGILYLNVSLSASPGSVVGNIDGVNVLFFQNVSSSSTGRRENVPIIMGKGDTLNVTITNGGLVTSTVFIPLK